MRLGQLGPYGLELRLRLRQHLGLLRQLGQSFALRLTRSRLQLRQRRLHIVELSGGFRHLGFQGSALGLSLIELLLRLLQIQHGVLKLLLQAFPLTLQDFHLLLRHPQGLLGIRSLLVHLRQLALVQSLHFLNARQVFPLSLFELNKLIGSRADRLLQPLFHAHVECFAQFGEFGLRLHERLLLSRLLFHHLRDLHLQPLAVGARLRPRRARLGQLAPCLGEIILQSG